MGNVGELIKTLKCIDNISSYDGCICTLQELHNEYNKLIGLMYDKKTMERTKKQN